MEECAAKDGSLCFRYTLYAIRYTF